MGRGRGQGGKGKKNWETEREKKKKKEMEKKKGNYGIELLSRVSISLPFAQEANTLPVAYCDSSFTVNSSGLLL